ncbi:MAG: hypothetical protein JO145_07895 [Acidobacteriaceae bacterium]|nr:hypothetical protein [Acidobacteriaceae bacterium]
MSPNSNLLYLDPDKLLEATPGEVLEAAARGHLGLDHRFLHALLDRPEESLRAVLAFAERDHIDDKVDLDSDLISLFRYWNAREGIPFLIRYVKEDPESVPDEAIEALVQFGEAALEPLLDLYKELDESESGEVAFILASLGIRDERIRNILLDRHNHDPDDAGLLLEIYDGRETPPLSNEEEFDIWASYSERASVPTELLDEDERAALLDHPVASVRATAASSFFNRDVSAAQLKKLLNLAKHDESPAVRARAWEALTNSTEETQVVEAMLAALRNPETTVEELGGLLVGLAPEADRIEVRAAITNLYGRPEGRAKALEAMWRSLHPSFRDYFPKHLDDADLEIRRGAVWGVGYHAIKSELDRLRKFFDDEDLRGDALFAYALALPTEISHGRMKGLLARIEKDARGLSELDETLVKAALDERLMLAGKEPFFMQQED